MTRAKQSKGGYEQDLRDAENAMIAAGHPDVALQMRRHSEAIRNYMQGAIVPMFVEMVDRSIGGKIDGLRADVQGWASESAARLGKLEQEVTDLRASHEQQDTRHKGQVNGIIERLDHKRTELDNHEERLRRLEARAAALSETEVARLIAVVRKLAPDGTE